MPLIDQYSPGQFETNLPEPGKAGRHRDPVLVIDNGSYSVKGGWSFQDLPCMNYESTVTKYGHRKTSGVIYGLGNNFSAPSDWIKVQQKNPFDMNVPSNFEAMELELDGIFSYLGIGKYPIEYPLVMTETLCMPEYSRKHMVELMFECYGIPKLSFGNDALMSLYYNRNMVGSSLIISFGHYDTRIIPVINGHVDKDAMKTLNVGGFQLAEYLVKLVNTKYNSPVARLNWIQGQKILRNYTYVAQDYFQELESFGNRKVVAENNIYLKTGYVEEKRATSEDPKQLERRKVFGDKMRQLAEQRRNERLQSGEKELEELEGIRDRKKECLDEREYLKVLRQFGYGSEKEFAEHYEGIRVQVDTMRNKMAGNEIKRDKEYDFSLLEISDSECNEEQRREKKRLKLIKASAEARDRIRKEKERARQKEEEKEQREEEARARDLDQWIKDKKKQRKELMERLNQIQRTRGFISDRKGTASTVQLKRMSHLAGNEDVEKERRRKSKEVVEDGFGDDDHDWEMYRETDQAEESNVLAAMQEIDKLLERYDKNFAAEGTEPELFDYLCNPEQCKDHGISISIERIRVPEVLFRPYFVGNESAGIVETVDFVLRKHSNHIRQELVQDVFVTGGNSLYPGLVSRLAREIQMLSPTDNRVSVSAASNPIYDAWRGAARWGRDSTNGETAWMNRAVYEEEGYHRTVEKLDSLMFIL